MNSTDHERGGSGYAFRVQIQVKDLQLMTHDKRKDQVLAEENSEILILNKPGLTDPVQIIRAETEGFIEAEASLLAELTDETNFDRKYICDIHRRALSHLYPTAGEYRSENIFEEDGGDARYAAAQAIPQAMSNLENSMLVHLPDVYDTREALVHDIGMIHAELLFIHPFSRGNRRTMRILANMMSLKAGYDFIDFCHLAEDEDMRRRYWEGVQAVLDEDYTQMIELINELLPEKR